MGTPAIDVTTVDDLKRRAIGRAEDLGHQLGPFQTAKHDPSCHVAFCAQCRQMVIVSVAHASNDRRPGALYGYALEAPCAVAATHH